MNADDRTVYGLEAPLRLLASHAIANPGFQSERRGKFVAKGASFKDQPAEIDLRGLTILGSRW